jgi:4-phytase/acid phosphatase
MYADSDQRTRETGKALAQGLMPGCNLPVQFLPEGTNDPLFHPIPEILAHYDPAIAEASIAGRIGGDPAKLTAAYHADIAALDHILASCGAATASKAKRVSLFDIPATLSPGAGDHLADLKGPLNTSSTLSENFLLEYTEGMDSSDVGWGCVHRAELETLMSLHTAATDFAQRTPEIARAQASNVLEHIRLSIQQAIDRKPILGAMGKPSDRALILVGHDTNIENMSGALGLTWIVDGRRDDTPPGGALVFEVWRKPSSGEYSVRTYYTAQTLEQMRSSTTLTLAAPPERVPVFIPGCSRGDLSCSLPSFLELLDRVSDKRAIVMR